MLKNLSYFNLVLAVCYFLLYLQNGSSFVIAGLLGVVVYNWIILRNMERSEKAWKLWQVIPLLLSLFFALYTGFSSFELLLDALDYHFFPAGTVWMIIMGSVFVMAIVSQIFLSWKYINGKKDH